MATNKFYGDIDIAGEIYRKGTQIPTLIRSGSYSEEIVIASGDVGVAQTISHNLSTSEVITEIWEETSADNWSQVGVDEVSVDDTNTDELDVTFGSEGTYRVIVSVGVGVKSPAGYIQPGGFQLKNVTLNTKTSVELETGGVITATKLTDNLDVSLDVPDGLQAEADNSTYLLKGTWGPNNWYYLGIEGDSTGVAEPKLVYVQEGETIGDADLDTGYDSFVALSIPGAISGWVLTDGNGDLFEQDWTGAGYLPGETWCDTNSNIISTQTTSAPTTWTSIDVSGFVPPAKSSIKIQTAQARSEQETSMNLGLSSRFLSSATVFNAEIDVRIYNSAALDWRNIFGSLHQVENQTIYWAITHSEDDFEWLVIRTISYVEVV